MEGKRQEAAKEKEGNFPAISYFLISDLQLIDSFSCEERTHCLAAPYYHFLLGAVGAKQIIWLIVAFAC